jgi:hypothetical protein
VRLFIVVAALYACIAASVAYNPSAVNSSANLSVGDVPGRVTDTLILGISGSGGSVGSYVVVIAFFILLLYVVKSLKGWLK